MTAQDLIDLNIKLKATGVDPDFKLHHDGKEVTIDFEIKPAERKIDLTFTHKF